MSNPVPFPVDKSSVSVRDERDEAMATSVRIMLNALPSEQQEAILEYLLKLLRPISTPKAGELLGIVVKLLPKRKDWSVEELKREVAGLVSGATPKEIYNALGYLKRKGHVRRVGYGRYVVQGVEISTSDDFGGASSRHEDAYRVERED